MKVENCDVGFIGLGVMGKSMAERLRAAGAKMHVFTRTKKSAEEILSKGAVWYDDPASLAPKCKIIFTIVGYPQDVEETYFGEKGLLKTAKPGTIFADMTTSSPILAKKIYDEAKKKECFSVDAPVPLSSALLPPQATRLTDKSSRGSNFAKFFFTFLLLYCLSFFFPKFSASLGKMSVFRNQSSIL